MLVGDQGFTTVEYNMRTKCACCLCIVRAFVRVWKVGGGGGGGKGSKRCVSVCAQPVHSDSLNT